MERIQSIIVAVKRCEVDLASFDKAAESSRVWDLCGYSWNLVSVPQQQRGH